MCICSGTSLAPFRSEGYEIVTAPDGSTGLDILGRPCIVLFELGFTIITILVF